MIDFLTIPAGIIGLLCWVTVIRNEIKSLKGDSE